MIVDIFCVTYGKDAHWLDYMLRSIQKFARGFRKTIVVYPTADAEVVEPILIRFPFVKPVAYTLRHDGYLYQNIIKSSCDLYSDAQYFLHMDSDCVFTEEACPEDYMTDGKCDLYYSAYAEIKGFPWRGVTMAALGAPVDHETMRRFPFLYPRWLYSATRLRIQSVHGKPFEKYVLNAPRIDGALLGYSEFNALGCMAKYFHPQEFALYDYERGNHKPAKVKQYWSHSGMTPEERAELEKYTEGWNHV